MNHDPECERNARESRREGVNGGDKRPVNRRTCPVTAITCASLRAPAMVRGRIDRETARPVTTPTDSPPTEVDGPSGFRQLLGYGVECWRENEAVVSISVGPRHLNRAGNVHGGLITTLIDAAAGFAGCYTPVPGNVRKATTLSMSTQFIAPLNCGRLIASARVTGSGHKIFHVGVDVRDAQGALIATGQCTYKYLPGSEDPNGQPLARGPVTRGLLPG